jgi:hypothetical protein
MITINHLQFIVFTSQLVTVGKLLAYYNQRLSIYCKNYCGLNKCVETILI